MSSAEKLQRLKNLSVDEVSFVDVPAVPKAVYLISKRAEVKEVVKTMDLADLEKRIAPYGYTGSAAGATSPAHIHEYYVYVGFDQATGAPSVDGYLYSIADHSHRITSESYSRGETEESDGHIHTLMIIKEARALLKIASERPISPPILVSEFSDEQKSRLDRVAASRS